jgi:hypothetical protein
LNSFFADIEEKRKKETELREKEMVLQTLVQETNKAQYASFTQHITLLIAQLGLRV